MTATLKRLAVIALVGAVAGAAVASLISPGLISWYNEPGFAVPPGYNLAPFVRQVTGALLKAQLIGAGAGVVAALALGLLLGRAISRKSP